MRKIIIGGAAVSLGLATALAISASAATPTGFKVTGGGQVFASSNSAPSGAGDTIALTARNVDGATGASGSDTAQGQVQYVQRVDGAEKFHGVVTCLQVDAANKVARIAGSITRSTDGTLKSFRIVISDADSGAAQNSGTDAAQITTSTGDSNCDATDQDDTNMTLARGNFQIHPTS